MGATYSAATLSSLDTGSIRPQLSASTPQQLALIFQLAEAQGFGPAAAPAGK